MFGGGIIMRKRKILVTTLILTLIVSSFGIAGFASDEKTDDKKTSGGISATELSEFKLDSERMIFGKIGDTLNLVPEVKYKGDDNPIILFKSDNEKIATVDKNGKVTAKGWGECYITAMCGAKRAKAHVTVAKKWVAITYDDGPGEYSEKLVKALKKENAVATFYMLGSVANHNKKYLKLIYEDGHEIANHTYEHLAAPETLRNQLNKTDKVIKSVTGKNTTLMRPPGGSINKVTTNTDKAVIMWSVDTLDWKYRDVDRIQRVATKNIKSGDIILLHDIHPKTVAASPYILKTLKEKGFALVTTSEIIGNPKAGKVYRKGSKKVKTMKIKSES